MPFKDNSFKKLPWELGIENKWEYSNYSKIDSEVKRHFPFENARENQLETISEIKEAIDNGYKYIILEAGTGTGKSAIAATLASMYDSTYILTVTKQLQDQYINDFKDLGFKVVKGRSNFKCKKYAEEGINQSCDDGRCIIEGYSCEYSIKKNYGNPSKNKVCEYDWQKFQGLMASVVISNYPYLFLELNYVEDFRKRTLMIFDEAHNLESSIMNQLKLELNRKDLKEYIGVNLSKETIAELNDGDFTVWIQFIKKIKDKYRDEYDKIKNIKKDEVSQKRNYLKKRIDDCNRFISHIKSDPDKWIFDYDSFWAVGEFKPVKVDNYSKDTFLQYGDVCIFMSATILDYKLFAKWLGLNEKEVYPIRQKSPFEINRNPIKTFDEFDMSYNNLSNSAPKTIDTINRILDCHKDEKGIIHTISHQCKNYLMKNLKSNRLIDHKTRNRTQQLNKFKKSKKPLVFISPSMNEGVDLPGELCRFQIIYKIPFPNMADKQTKKRMGMDEKWYKYKTSLSLVQTLGRGMRYEDDYCMTYFMDRRLENFILADELNYGFLPDSFKDAVNIEPAKIDKSKVKKHENTKINLRNIASMNQDNMFFSPIKIKSHSFEDSEEKSDYISMVDLKYELTMNGIELLKNGHYEDAVDFYNDLLTNELFIHDYHPYLKLAKAYRALEQYDNEVDIITKFFNSGIYARNSTINWFKKKLKQLDELGYYDYSWIDELEYSYKMSGKRNSKLSKIPVPLAVDIKGGKKNNNNNPTIIDPSVFDEYVEFDENLSYEEKIKFKEQLMKFGQELISSKKYPKAIAFYNRLLNHELFYQDYLPYKKLAASLKKDKQRIEEGKVIARFFKSGIYCDDDQVEKFINRLKYLSNYGHFDPSKIKELKNEFYNNGALNQNNFYVIDNNLKKTGEINTAVISRNNYSIKYFNNLAKEISEKEGFVSDRDLLKYSEGDFTYIGNGDAQLNKKANLKNKGKELEKEDEEKAVKFYDNLKTNELFKYDYYPYRRQCILFKNKIKDDLRDWDTIKEIFKNEIYLNQHQYIWLNNKVLELIAKLELADYEIHEMEELLKNFDKNHHKFNKPSIPIAERIIKEEDEQVKLLSVDKYDYLQDIFYVKELGVGYIRRCDYENAFPYYFSLLNNDFLFFKYHAYKQFARIYKEMKNPNEFERLYEKYKKIK